jgi:lipopolysaccharide export system permease protein
MVPILWRHLLQSFLKVFFLSVSSFIAVLVVMRMEEIARFASSGAPWSTVLLFTFYQIPYILPLAIPVSCLVATFILCSQMSKSHGFTSLRAAGISLKNITIPIVFLSIFLSLCNFLISSELAPYMRARAKELVFQATTGNPLILLQKDALVKFRNAFLDMKARPGQKRADDVLFIVKNSSSERLGLMVAKSLDVVGGDLRGSQVTFISSIDPKIENSFDHLVIENQMEMTTASAGLSQLWDDARWQLQEDYLPLRLILAKQAVEKGDFLRKFDKSIVEFARRYSLALATISFTLLGIAFGIQIGRQVRKHTILSMVLFATLFLACFMAAKSLKNMPMASFFLYLAPHPLIVMISLVFLRRIEKGVES